MLFFKLGNEHGQNWVWASGEKFNSSLKIRVQGFKFYAQPQTGAYYIFLFIPHIYKIEDNGNVTVTYTNFFSLLETFKYSY